MDKWILSRLNTTVAAADEHMANYRIPETGRVLSDFVDELSNWYVRRCRERFWVQGETDDKTAAYMTLWTALTVFAKTAAPLIPFMTEEIYQNLVISVDKTAPESVHLCAYPQADTARIDTQLEEAMKQVLLAVTLGRAARNDAAIKNRQPLRKMYVSGDKAMDDVYCQIIREELNVKEVAFVSDASSFLSYTFKPQLRLLGKKLGSKLGAVRQALTEGDGNAMKKELDATGFVTLTVDGESIPLSAEELLIETTRKEGYASQSDYGVTVALDVTLDEALIEEGFVREIISKVQSMRKDSGFEVTDHIELAVSGNEKIEAIVSRNTEAICGDVLADKVVYTTDATAKEWDINGEKANISVKVI